MNKINRKIQANVSLNGYAAVFLRLALPNLGAVWWSVYISTYVKEEKLAHPENTKIFT